MIKMLDIWALIFLVEKYFKLSVHVQPVINKIVNLFSAVWLRMLPEYNFARSLITLEKCCHFLWSFSCHWLLSKASSSTHHLKLSGRAKTTKQNKKTVQPPAAGSQSESEFLFLQHCNPSTMFLEPCDSTTTTTTIVAAMPSIYSSAMTGGD